ncbi:MAG TPA: bifunctional transaldolase/phosoglucose isomerase [Candidatus Dormibacteraeota bacterium]|nr:bifunctional transaldolase/phosoglucose isomerase [Candidatus Dormibacteraeota bacterium]
MAGNPLQQLAERGQSVWLDFINRELVTGDRLQTLIDNDNVTGMTSNPTIFEKAIGEGSDYDEQIRQLVGAGVTGPDDLFIELSVSDIQHAADILRPIFDRTAGGDGFVSVEVSPHLAHDTEATVAAANYLWERVERPNVMVKIPATPEGIPAIQRCISAGLNINVTLIFALAAYEAVAEAYISGLENRAADGKPLSNRSVASFFVSRVDTAVDKLLEEKLAAKPGDPELTSLLGKAGIANSVLAYEKFEELFSGERFARLRENGAAVQRMLWASTSSKNPKYRDVYIAEALVGPNTIDTMPPAVIEAFADHGRVDGDTVRSDYAGAHRVLERLAAVGIDIDKVTQQLLDAGVASFGDSYDQLVRTIAIKADAMHGGFASRQRLDLGDLTDAVYRAAAAASADGVVRRIWERDPDLWKPGDAAHAAEIRIRLGWLDVVDTMRQQVGALTSFAAEIRDAGIRDVVLLGMGGSSLCPEVLRTSFASAPGYPTLHVLDTTDPAAIAATTSAIDARRSLFIVASKSGGTVETLSHFAHFWDVVSSAGVDKPGDAFVAITDPGTSLVTLAQQHSFRRIFENPPDIGGRYSALSYFGLVPGALLGIDVAALLERARAMARQCAAAVHPSVNCGLVLGTAMGLCWQRGRDKVTILATSRIAAFSLWAEQLIAESTGKEGKGIVPIGAEPIGEPGVYGDDRLFVVLRLGDDPDFDRRVDALRAAGQPMITLELDDLLDLGAEFFRWEFATAVAGATLQIDPFDQPNVQESKDNTRRLLDAFERDGKLPPVASPTAPNADRLAELLSEVNPSDYVALMAYVTPTADNETALQQLRVAIRDRYRVSTTLGFGPRFLHSTGQLHKGGPNTGVYVQVTVDDSVDVAIPGQRYTFATLKRAQAQGDLESLHAHNRRAVGLHIVGDLAAELRALASGVSATTGVAH